MESLVVDWSQSTNQLTNQQQSITKKKKKGWSYEEWHYNLSRGRRLSFFGGVDWRESRRHTKLAWAFCRLCKLRKQSFYYLKDLDRFSGDFPTWNTSKLVHTYIRESSIQWVCGVVK